MPRTLRTRGEELAALVPIRYRELVEEARALRRKLLSGLITDTRRASSTYQIEPVRMSTSLDLERARRRAAGGSG
jgi:hypothetical protein